MSKILVTAKEREKKKTVVSLLNEIINWYILSSRLEKLME